MTAPYVNDIAFPNASSARFWSSTPDTGNAGNSWNVLFENYGISEADTVDTLANVRCVRSCYPTTMVTSRYSVSSGQVIDMVTSLIWQQNASSATMNWGDAAAYCANQTTGGVSGWRVPNIAELGTLVDYTISSPSINLTAFPGTLSSPFRSSTPAAGNAGYAWNVYENDGGVYSYPKSAGYLVRCIRSCYSSPTTRYVAALGVVTDTVTGLVWQQKVSYTMIYLDAVRFCRNFNLSSYVWRLPTIKEL